MILAVAFFMPVLLEYFVTGLVPRFPTLIVCVMAMLAALQLFVAGVILSTLQEKDKRDFEYKLQQVQRAYREMCSEESRSFRTDVPSAS